MARTKRSRATGRTSWPLATLSARAYPGGAGSRFHAATYAALCLVLAAVLLGGPLRVFLRGDTTTIADYVDTGDVGGAGGGVHPTLVLCNVRPYAAKAREAAAALNASSVSPEEAFSVYAAAGGDAWRVGSFVDGAWVTRSYAGGPRRAVNASLFRPVLVDAGWFGICFALDLGPVILEDWGADQKEFFSSLFILALRPHDPSTPPEVLGCGEL